MIWWDFLIHDEVRMLRGQAETCSGSQASPQPGGSHGAHLTTPSAPSCLFPGSTYGCNLRLELPRLLPGPRSTGWQENSTFIYLFVGLLVFDISQTRFKGFPGGARGKEPACQCRRCKRPRFDPWVGKISWRRKWKPTRYSCLEKPVDRGLGNLTSYSPQGHKESDLTEVT